MTNGQERELTIFCRMAPTIQAVQDMSVRPEDHRIIIWTATLDSLRAKTSEYHALLDRSEQHRLERYRFEQDQERFLLGHGFLRSVLSGYVAQPAKSLLLQRGKHGKPFLADHRLKFNMSDTKDAVAVAVSFDQELGVDIETNLRSVDHVAVGDHYFTPEEILSIQEAPDGKRRFLEFWTRKEAILKASGVGIMDDLHVLRVDAPVNELKIAHVEFVNMAAPAYHVSTWDLQEHHIISLATPEPPSSVDFVVLA